MITLAVFDWNGTLIADTKAIVEGGNKELEIFGCPPITLATFRQHYDIPLEHVFYALGVDPDVFKAKAKEASEAFHAYYEPRVARARTRSGARETLKALAEKSVTNVILSNHTMEGIYLQLERLKLSHYFAAVLANGEKSAAFFGGKRDRLHAYMEKQGIAPSQTVIIGDTVEEVRIARDLGIKVVCMTGGYNSTARLMQAKPDALIHKLSDVPAVLKEL